MNSHLDLAKGMPNLSGDFAWASICLHQALYSVARGHPDELAPRYLAVVENLRRCNATSSCNVANGCLADPDLLSIYGLALYSRTKFSESS
jgi:hypothetical protein